MVKVKKPTLFDYLNQISNKSTKYKWKDKDSKTSAYMLSLWLSHDPQLIPLVQKISKYQFELPDKVIYDYYYHTVPKRKKRYIKWTKKTPEDKKRDKLLKVIQEEYKVSKNESKKILMFKEKLNGN